MVSPRQERSGQWLVVSGQKETDHRSLATSHWPLIFRRTMESGNQDNDILFVYRHPDGAVTLYSDEEWAIERGIKPEDLHVVEIPRRLYAEGTIQEVREYVAQYLEAKHERSS